MNIANIELFFSRKFKQLLKFINKVVYYLAATLLYKKQSGCQ